MSKNGKRFRVNQDEFREVMNMGYVVEKKTFWHYRIFKNYDLFLDVFPTTRVWCLFEDKKYVTKGNYDDLLEVVETKLDSFI